MNPLLALAEKWRSEAELFRRYGNEQGAAACELHADELEEKWGEWQDEPLTVAEAAVESGYSEDHLRQLIREGRIPDNRASGSQGAISVRRGDLPKKPGQRQPVAAVEAMAAKLLDARR
jgi:hypothetical protein